MRFFDVNVLVYAFRSTAADHALYRDLVAGARNGTAPFAVHDVVLAGFVRTVTHGVKTAVPETPERAFAFCDWLLRSPSCVRLSPTARAFELFRDLCVQLQVTGSRTTDAYLAATSIANDCTWLTADRGFAVYPRLRWQLLPDGQTRTNPT
jgi:hypothetical protein